MKMKITKWIIFEDSLFILFYPFLAFDIFLFYDEGCGIIRPIATAWLIFFAIALVCYVHDRMKCRRIPALKEIVEIAFFSFEVLFFAGNFFLAGMFLMIMYAGNPYLI